ncbi:MAG: AAA family ATPase [Chloroflexi bacterium]|nr:AAA family ATPase [Chloroflexota bacterium]
MIKRSLAIGLIGGIVISLAGLYPIVSLLAPLWLDGWQRPFANELIHGLWLMGSAALMIPTLLFLGGIAAYRARARGVIEGVKAGVLAALTAGGLCYFTLISPVNALIAFGTLGADLNVLVDSFVPSSEALSTYVVAFQNSAFQTELLLGAAAIFWGAQGALVGWRQRNLPLAARPSLLQLIQSDKNPKKWFAGDETAVQVGVVVGFVVAFLTIITASGWSYLAVADGWPEMINALHNSHIGMIITSPLKGIAPVLSPFLLFAVLAFGGLVVAFVKNPPNWFRARYGGVLIASLAFSLAAFAVALRTFYFNLGLAPFWVLRQLEITSDPTIISDLTELINMIEMAYDEPALLVGVVLIVPWAFLLAAVVTAVVVGTIQAICYIPVLSMLHKRPVDKAFMAQRHLRRNPAELLPDVYKMFHKSAQAYDVLAHICTRAHKRRPDISLFAAAYHTLGTTQIETEYTPAIETLHDTLLNHREWRWSLDFAGSYQTLSQVLAARSLEQILQIDPPPEQHTSSLPPLVVKSGQKIGRIVQELQKVEKTDDLSTKLIFLENALSTIHEMQRFVDKEFTNPTYWATPLPQHKALQVSLQHWEEIVLTAVQRLKGRADIVSTLKTHHCTFVPEMPLACSVSNQGLNVAQQVRVKLLPGEGYDLLGVKSERLIEILPPGEQKEVSLTIMPREEVKRLRVAWEVVYDDAVDDARHISFADQIEFVEAERPFTRIFPIPYVTGTPLKTDDVFVGRDDVFGFIQEMLVGAHQNNIVILHGQRRTGKTSVLYRLHEMLADTHYTVLIDMQGKPARGEADFLYAIADDIVFAFEDHEIEIDLPARADFQENPEFVFGSRFIRSLKPHLNGKNVLLMFDEFEELQRRVEDGRLQPEIFQFFRNLMQHEAHLDFIFAGTHKLEELGAEYWSALFNIAAYRPITFLRPLEMRRLILEPIKQYHTEFDPLAIERIIGVTAGHPYFAQLLLHEMMVYHNEMKASYLTAVDVDQVIDRIIGRGEAHFRYIWDESSEEERLLLRAMTELVVSSDGATSKALRTFLMERGYKSADRWKKALSSLEDREILARSDAKSPLYRFKVALIRLWIDRTRPAL